MVDGEAQGNIGRFDPVTETFPAVANTATNEDRWYPSTLIMGNGKAITFGGTGVGGVSPNLLSAEVYDPDTDSVTLLNSGGNVLQYQDVANAYPRLFLTSVQNANPNIFRVFHCGVAADSWFYDINTDTNTSTVINGPTDPQTPGPGGGEPAGRLQAIYVRLHDGRIMAAGGDRIDETAVNSNTVSIVDPQAASPQYSAAANMNFGRSYFLATLLIDGTVLVYGSGTSTELYDPVANSWTNTANMSLNRAYHTSGVLMPDGKIIVSGGEGNGGSGEFGETDQIQIYSPDYLSAGPQPSISTAPTTASYGDAITVNYSSSNPITEVVLRRPGSATHSFTYNMIGVPVSFTDNGPSLTVNIPTNRNLVPPGYYMLFILSDNSGTKVPSTASWINIGGGVVPDTDPPTPNPATFASAPSATSDTAISMTATTGTDASTPIEYSFVETSGNPGGTSSGWQQSAVYTDSV